MRHLSRQIALQILFQNEFSSEVPESDFLRLEKEISRRQPGITLKPEVIHYARSLVNCVIAHDEKLKSLIQKVARHWTYDRMSSVDRNILRVAIAEMKFMDPTIEPKIAIDEAVNLAKTFGTTESSAFVNGLLDAVLHLED